MHCQAVFIITIQLKILNTIPLLFFCIGAFLGCARQSTEQVVSYPRHIGDHAFDADVDDPTFKVCNDTLVLQYYNFGKGMQYKGEKTRIDSAFANVISDQKDSGFITIRFVVNCEGETGWFRVQEMDFDYKEKSFSTETVTQLLAIVKDLDGWKVGSFRDVAYDYYQYLTFKFQNGKLVGIMP